MTDDPTKKIKEHGKIPDNGHDLGDNINELLSMVRAMSVDLQDVKSQVGTVEKTLSDMNSRVEAVEKAISERLYDTKPIWERALAEILETRAELAATRSELEETRSEVRETRLETREAIQKLKGKIDIVIQDAFELRTEQQTLERRVGRIEDKA
jgi:chromosome segregation ATPase